MAFLAVPHTASLALTPELLKRGVTVLDLSADYRLHDPQVYEQWYNTPHTSPELLSQTVYGLPELNREGILALAERRAAGQAVLVSVPGCYPTATALAATPALSAGLAGGDLVIADAISGVSGAGRGANARTHYCHANESVEAYGVAKHRHTPEIEQTLSEVAGRQMNVVFTPHLAPLTRGLLSTVYLEAQTASPPRTSRPPMRPALPMSRWSRFCPQVPCPPRAPSLALPAPRWAWPWTPDADAPSLPPAPSTTWARALPPRPSRTQTSCSACPSSPASTCRPLC